jgi:hypothetical protein
MARNILLAYRLRVAALGVVLLATAALAQGPTPLQQALKDLEVKGDWHYNDLAAGFARAKETGKPLLVVFR